MKQRIIYDGNGEVLRHYIDGEIVQGEELPMPDAPLVMGDIQPYQSMIDGSWITSRSRHREHLRAAGCIEVGNDTSLNRTPGPLQPPEGLKERIARNVYSKLRY